MPAHIHWVIWAAEGRSEEGYRGVTYVDVIAPTMEDALSRAKQLCPGRAFYWVNSVIEHDPDAEEVTELPQAPLPEGRASDPAWPGGQRAAW